MVLFNRFPREIPYLFVNFLNSRLACMLVIGQIEPAATLVRAAVPVVSGWRVDAAMSAAAKITTAAIRI
jgi:hypothetical protein